MNKMKNSNVVVRMAYFVMGLIVFVCPQLLYALPEGGVVVEGVGSIGSPNEHTLQVSQSSDVIGMEFTSFSLSENELVEFFQPDQNALAVARVIGASASEIMGRLQANGQVFLVNPNGVLFGETSQVDVGGLIVSTASIESWEREEIILSVDNTSTIDDVEIINQGRITVADNGVTFLGSIIANDGEIIAKGGDINLQSARQFLVRIDENNSTTVLVDKESMDGLITNNGKLMAHGGDIALQANLVDQVLDTVINNDGIVIAERIERRGGNIYLSGSNGDVLNAGEIASVSHGSEAGTIDITANRIAQIGSISSSSNNHGGIVSVSADDKIRIAENSTTSVSANEIGHAGEIIYKAENALVFDRGAVIRANGGSLRGDGGFVEVSGLSYIHIAGDVDTSAVHGENGTLLIDPVDLTISDSGSSAFNTLSAGNFLFNSGSGSVIDAASINTFLGNGNVFITTDQGGAELGVLTVDADIDLNGSNGNTLTLRGNQDININANICDMGAAGMCDGVGDITNLTITSLDAGGNINIAAQSIIDSGGGSVIIDADGTINLAQGALIDSGDSGLPLATLGDVNINSDAGDINVLGDITHSSSITLTATNTLTLPDAGLHSQGRITLLANHIRSASNSAINITASELSYQADGLDTTHSLNVDVDTLSADLTGSGDFNIVSRSDLIIDELGDFSDGISVGHGNITLTVNNGDLTVNDDIVASDIVADGIRSGLVDIAINEGNLNVGLLNGNDNAGAIESFNEVDQNVDGGLGRLPTSQVSLRIRQLSTFDTPSVFTFGDNSSGDTSALITARGGDIYIDATNGVILSPGVERIVILNEDVILTTHNSVFDTPDGAFDFADIVDNGAIISTHTGRFFQINGNPDIINPTIPLGPITVDSGNLLDDASIAAGEALNLTNDQRQNSSLVDAVLKNYLVGCEAKVENDRGCEKNEIIKDFLESLLISVEFPIGNI